MKRETVQRHSLKVMAIFFAFSLWFYIINSEPIQVEKKLIINYIVPKGHTIANLSEKEVTLKLKGSKAFLQNIFSNKEKFNVDLNPYFISSGKSFKVKFYASDLVLPFGVEVVDLSPKDTMIELDRMVSIEMPIKVLYIGDAPKERKIKEVVISPRSVKVSGPLEILKTLSRIDSAPVNLALFNKDEGSTTVSLSDLDPRLKYEDAPNIKINYKTQLLTSKRNLKKD